MSEATTKTTRTPDSLTNLLALLPTSTFLVFSAIVPITTNNGNCHEGEKIVTGVIVLIFTLTCALVSFTDSYSTPDGTMWYGLVTPKGLWNPSFGAKGLADVNGWTYVGGGTKYMPKFSDFYVMTLSMISFVTLTLLSSNLTDCFYPGIDGNIMKAIPLPINFFIGIAFSFAPPARHSVGFAFKSSTTSSSSSSTTTTEKPAAATSEKPAGATSEKPAGATSEKPAGTTSEKSGAAISEKADSMV